MSITVIRNARVLNLDQPDDDGRYAVVVENGLIREVTSAEVNIDGANVIEANGKTLMPGLIDCHVHAITSLANLGLNGKLPNTFTILHAVPIVKAMLYRGFTTARDAGGADYALAQAIANGVIPGPRLFISGKALSQTGGHGDFRGRYDNSDPDPCECSRNMGAIGRVVDGVDEVRKAVREEIRQGASQIKIMASGGVASPTDPIGNMQFSVDEVKAIVEETKNHQTYVMAHAYTSAAIKRVIELGVRTIEHGNLIDDETAAFMASKGAYVVPTNVVYDVISKIGLQAGMGASAVEKNEVVRIKGLEALEILHRNGVKMGYGSDLLGEMHGYQSDELLIRAKVLGNVEVLRQATLIGAEILRQEGKLGVVAQGAIADLLLVDGDPVKNIEVLTGQGEKIDMIMKDGNIIKLQ